MLVSLAFFRRDALIWASYRLAVVWQMLGVFVLIGVVYIIGSSVDSNSSLLPGNDVHYVAFVLSGIAFTDLLMQGLHALPESIRENQKSGTLEAMLLTPIGALQLAVSSALFRFAQAAIRMMIYLLFGALALGYWGDANIAAILVVFVPAALLFISVGVLSSAFIILVKQGDPVLVAFGAVTSLLGGLLFPVDALPGWVQPFSTLIPQTHALSGFRDALNGATVLNVVSPALALVVMLAVTAPIAIFAFHWAVNRAKREGTLAQY